MNEAANKLHHAAQLLAGVCDGAIRPDGAGFNKPDSKMGMSLALHPPETWDTALIFFAHGMLYKYRKQLMGMGFDWDTVPFVEQTTKEPAPIRTIDGVGGRLFAVHLDYHDFDARHAIKKLPNRHWNDQDKTWEILRSSLAELITWANQWHAGWTPKAVEIRDATYIPEDEPTPTPTPKQGKTCTLTDTGIKVGFPYDPAIVEFLRIMRSKGTAMQWDKDTKTWSIRILTDGDIDRVIGLSVQHDIPLTQVMIDALDDMINLKNKGGSALVSITQLKPMGLTLRPFQVAGVDFILQRKSVLVADQMGLGKTIEALAAIEQANAYPALIITPASVKYNWQKEANRLLPNRTTTVLNGGKVNHYAIDDVDIVIINYDILGKWMPVLDRHWSSVVCDESHMIKNGKAQRTENAQALMKRAYTLKILLTGTPILNRPIELVSQLIAIDALHVFGGWKSFVNRYCAPQHNGFAWDYSGASNLEELNQKLRATCYLRREKEEVLPDLPKFSRDTVLMSVDNKAAIAKATRDLINYLRETQGTAAARAASRAETLVRINTLRQLVAQGKLSSAKEWVADFLSSGRKLVLFAWHKSVVSAMMETFAEYNPAKIDGSTPAGKRQSEVEKFQEDDSCRLIVCNIIAAGEGITLTAASDVAFIEHAWNPGKEEQAEARIHRMGQEYPCTAWYLDAQGTIDDDMRELIESKRHIVHAGAIGISNEEDTSSMLDELIDKLIGKEN